MKVHWTDWAFVAVLLSAGCAAIYAGLSRAFRYAVTEQQKEMGRQINAMAATVKALQGQVAEIGRVQTERGQRGEATAEVAAEGPASQESGKKEPMTPETLATLTAATTTFLRKNARIRSARALGAEETATAWAQQGRVIVQTSHNLRQNG